MASSYVIFVNPDTTSDIYNLINPRKGGGETVTSSGGEITLDELELAVGNATQDIIYVLHSGFSTSMSSTQFQHLNPYLKRLYNSTTDNVDLFYLSNFMDNCLNRVELATHPGVGETSIKSVSFTFATAPNGIGCVATTKTNWLKIIALAKTQEERNLSAKLSALVISEDIIAATSQPLFVFPDLQRQTDALDALKTQYCRIEKNFGRAVPNTENLSFFWFVLGVTVIVFVAWVLSYFMRKNRVLMVKKY
jgi:hypothetical protein